MPNPTETVSRLLETFYTIRQRMDRTEQDLRELRNEVSALRTEHSDVKARLAALEEARNTAKAELRAVVAETVAELRIRFSEAQGEAAPQRSLPRRAGKTGGGSR